MARFFIVVAGIAGLLWIGSTPASGTSPQGSVGNAAEPTPVQAARADGGVELVADIDDEPNYTAMPGYVEWDGEEFEGLTSIFAITDERVAWQVGTATGHVHAARVGDLPGPTLLSPRIAAAQNLRHAVRIGEGMFALVVRDSAGRLHLLRTDGSDRMLDLLPLPGPRRRRAGGSADAERDDLGCSIGVVGNTIVVSTPTALCRIPIRGNDVRPVADGAGTAVEGGGAMRAIGDQVWFATGDVLQRIGESGPARAVVDLGASPVVGSIVPYRGGIAFAAEHPSRGTELYVSNGTPAGSYLVKDIRGGAAGSDPSQLQVANGTLYFIANDGVHGPQLWRSDGTSRNTSMVNTLGEPIWIRAYDNHLYITRAGRSGRIEPGTDAEVAWPVRNSTDYPPTKVGPYVFTTNSLYDTEQAQTVSGFGSGLPFEFHANSASAVRYSGVSAASGSRVFVLYNYVHHSGSVIGYINTPRSADNDELRWHYLCPLITPSSRPAGLISTRNGIYLSASGEVGGDRGLYRIEPAEDGGTDRRQVRNLPPGTASVTPLAEFDGHHYFLAASEQDGTHQLWRTDGGQTTTRIVPGRGPNNPDSVPFSSSSACTAVVLGDTLFLITSAAGRYEVWQVRARSGTRVEHVGGGASRTFPSKPMIVGGNAYLTADDDGGWWVMRIGANGIDRVAEQRANRPAVSELVRLQHGLAVMVGLPGGWQLWRFDPAAVASSAPEARAMQPIAQGEASVDDPPQMVSIQGRQLVFVASDREHGRELWVSDGSTDGTRLLQEIAPGSASSDPRHLVAAGDAAWFTATSPRTGRELWRTNGTRGGTTMIRELRPGPQGSNPRDLTPVGDGLVFSASDASSGREPWFVSNDGRQRVRLGDIALGAASSDPREFTLFGGRVYFVADDGARGREVWRMRIPARR